ncbi:hypothetical protein [Leeuwenhoekiella sp. W20_SRS_FM14]|uniref:hypothetical protein n=1 Tax=Leeuwenhoekiella sp. W20_SRS_FM14 TaxID=3240270 RepID=UPI003F9956AD
MQTLSRKVQNVPNLIICLILLLGKIALSQGQSLEGSYSALAKGQENYKVYTFLKDNKFEYHYGASLGDDEYGYGTYFITGDYLLLNFDTPPVENLYRLKVTKWNNSNDSLVIKVRLFDLKQNPIVGAYVNLVGLKTQKKKIDINGQTTFKILDDLSKRGDSLFLDVHYVGFETIKVGLIQESNMDFNINLSPLKGELIYDQIDTLHIREITNDKIFLRDENEDFTWYKIK